MSGLKTIRRRIVSVRNTKQITRAMKLVSAAKLRRAQDAALGGREFSRQLAHVLRRALLALPERTNFRLAEERPTLRRRRVIVIAGERGLCGGYNANVMKAVHANEFGNDIDVDFVLVGRRSVSAGRRFGWNIVEAYEGLGEDAGQWPTGDIADDFMNAFTTEACDEVVLYFTEFVSAVTQQVRREVLLPVTTLLSELPGQESSENLGTTSFDAPAAQIAEAVLPMLIRSRLRQAALEAKASEHAARMTAMDAATRNADDLIDRLRLFYNRARQTTITRELIDIVGGAEALK